MHLNPARFIRLLSVHQRSLLLIWSEIKWTRPHLRLYLSFFLHYVCVCVCRTLRADGVCESVLYGLPLVLLPTTCWQLDWDEMEANNNLFHALCHTLKAFLHRAHARLFLNLFGKKKTLSAGSDFCR